MVRYGYSLGYSEKEKPWWKAPGNVAKAVASPSNRTTNLETLKRTNACPNCDLREANLRGADLKGAKFDSADLAMAKMECPDLWIDQLGALLVYCPFQFRERRSCPHVFQAAYDTGSTP